jgi:predicted nuclease of predicted toxin-antitoxin system
MLPALKQHFDECFHVDSIGLNVPPKDSEIWDFARKNNLVIVTNDEDFIDFINVRGFPPKIILLRIGNQRRIYITNLLIQRKDEIANFSTSSEIGLLEMISK